MSHGAGVEAYDPSARDYAGHLPLADSAKRRKGS
jgi:hypothetical protein